MNLKISSSARAEPAVFTKWIVRRPASVPKLHVQVVLATQVMGVKPEASPTSTSTLYVVSSCSCGTFMISAWVDPAANRLPETNTAWADAADANPMTRPNTRPGGSNRFRSTRV